MFVCKINQFQRNYLKYQIAMVVLEREIVINSPGIMQTSLHNYFRLSGAVVANRYKIYRMFYVLSTRKRAFR